MTWWERWGVNTLHTVVAVTGVVYFYMKYANGSSVTIAYFM